MTSTVAGTAWRLPRGWAHLFAQIGIWLGFYVAYRLARAAADHSVVDAYRNGARIVATEHSLGALFEPTLQRAVDTSSFVVSLVSYTYWLSEFAVVGGALLWIYLRHFERFTAFRNWLVVANVVGLLGYVLVPTAPPRMFPEWGFVDTLARYSSLDLDSGLVTWAANQYAAMPSVHATDALIVGLTMAGICGSRGAKALWLAWPAWVAFAVVSTGNHFWLDVVAGFVLALATGVVMGGDVSRAARKMIRKSADAGSACSP